MILDYILARLQEASVIRGLIMLFGRCLGANSPRPDSSNCSIHYAERALTYRGRSSLSHRTSQNAPRLMLWPSEQTGSTNESLNSINKALHCSSSEGLLTQPIIEVLIMTNSIYQEKMSQLYKIVHQPTGLVYYGSCWKEGKSYLDRFQEHLKGNGRYLHKETH